MEIVKAVGDVFTPWKVKNTLKKKSTGEMLGRVTISVGVSMLKPGDDTDSLIERADACLYAAKRAGRNRVVCEADPEYVAEPRSQVA